jgi:fumarate hydratase subunit beta
MEIRQITTPLTEKAIEALKSGERVLLSGYIYTARDAAHKRMFDALREGKALPIDIKGHVIYYCGPSPTPPGKVIGSCGPTTSSRMDVYTPELLSLGLKGMIGKGKRSIEVKEAIKRYKAVYFGATGGAGALLSKCILSSQVLAYEDLGPEAIVRLEVKDMPLVVINDIYGNDLFEMGMQHYRRT